MARKSAGEERAEQVTVGLVLLALVPALVSSWHPYDLEGLSAVGVGLALLGSAFYQRAQSWPVGRLTWLVGTAAVLLGLVSVASSGRVHSATALVVVFLGLWFVGRGLGREV